MAKQSAPSTQEHLPIAGIIDGIVMMTDGSIRAILRVEPTNFDLKSEDEQNGIIYAYQSFLNSLDFPIQIVIQSKKLDLEQYLIRLQASQKNITNDLLRIQIEDYIGFVRRLISVANIMSKRFYIVISYAPITKASTVAQFSSIFHHQPTGPLMDEDEFKRYRSEVTNRAGIIAGGVARLGIKSSLLDTQELIELFYGIYNPDVVAEERLTDVDNLNAGIVSAADISPEANSAKISPDPIAPSQNPAQPEEPLPQPGITAPTPEPMPPQEPLAPETPAPEPPLEQPVLTQPAPEPIAEPAPATSLLDEPLTDPPITLTAPPPAPANLPSLQEQVATPSIDLEDLFGDEPPPN